MKAGRWLAWSVAGALLLAALVGVLRGWSEGRADRAAHPRLRGRVALPGLASPAVVLRDRRGVPHVEAATELDAWRALGFVHAQDRPTQMLWMRRAARGRLSEVTGADGLAWDREARVLGFARLASEEGARLPGRARSVLEAYAAGVSAHLASMREGRVGVPTQVAAWGAPIEAWTPEDSLALVKLLAWNLGGTLDESLVLTEVRRRVPDGREAAVFFPAGAGLRRLPSPGEGPLSASRAHGPRGPLRFALGLGGPGIGSAAFVVGGEYTRSGLPVLAYDAHFEPTVPAALYQAHLRGGALDVAGVGPPGVPAFWSGFNRSVAWASVHAPVVVADLYEETLSSDGARYRDSAGWREVVETVEEIPVRRDASATVRLRRTERGPLVGPLLAASEAGSAPPALALRWSGAEAGSGIAGFLDVAHADAGSDLRRALSRHHEPVFVVAYCDREGAAGLQMAGFVPERRLPSSLLSVPALDPDYAWRGRIAPERLPARRIRDGVGFEVAADGGFANAGGGLIEWLWRSGEREARIERLLYDAAQKRAPVGVREVLVLQRDVRTERAGAVVDLALELVGEDDPVGQGERELRALLRDWDRSAQATSRGAAAYHVFLERLTRELLEPSLGPELLRRYLALGRMRPAELVLVVLEGALADRPRLGVDRARATEAVRESLRQGWLRLSVELGTNREKWTWGRLHPLRFRSLFGPGRDTELGPFVYGGDGGSVQVADFRPLESFEVSTVASFRLVIDAAALDEALTSLAPGQSEHPGHPHRDDELPRWLIGRPGLLATSPLVVEEGASARLVLEPDRRPAP